MNYTQFFPRIYFMCVYTVHTAQVPDRDKSDTCRAEEEFKTNLPNAVLFAAQTKSTMSGQFRYNVLVAFIQLKL